ncbi:DinB superfamily protein [Cnuella takakiae]|uniref:DinB superfamily protein n=1 Tax=Cnuella takakiae TaxID=1302690 RepID=A0A1M5IC11_9BACT|nr:DinB family protein [Cnuella takakiae]OLY90797.1 hypothetical protein BUE76_01940 [Cnuella takakiae]SHG25904.1 DinB superfamily protein [Cnuella takakiae]
MQSQIENVKRTRIFLLDLVKDLTVAELNEVPEGFNNNIIWNLGHLVWAQQGICYLRAGMEPKVDASLLTPFRSGTKPEGLIDEPAIAVIKQALLSTIDQLEQDYAASIWQQYTAWTTRYGVELKSIEDALNFLLYHEGMHAGYIMALKRIVKPALVAG